MKQIKKIYRGMVLLLLVCSPVKLQGAEVACGEIITLKASTTGYDCYFEEGQTSGTKVEPTVSWSATAGTFPSGNTGREVDWIAPSCCTTVMIIAVATSPRQQEDDSKVITIVPSAGNPTDRIRYFPIGGCHLYSGPEDSGTFEDDCNNYVKVECSGGSGFYAYRFTYNGSNIGTCIFHNGLNDFQLRFTACRHRFYAARHSVFHNCNSNCNTACAPLGYYCWKVTHHDCINGGNIVAWRRSTVFPEYNMWWETHGEMCPGH